MRLHIVSAAVAMMSLAACSAGEEEDVNASVELGNGTVSISAPGFNMSADVPGDATRNVEITTDSEALYPGAEARGLSMTRDPVTGTNRIDIGFSSGDDVEQVAKWYGDPRRSGNFKVTGINQTEGVYTMSVVDDTGEFFNVILKPGEGGGTAGQLKFREKR